VIVPAMSRDDDPAVLAWIREQAEKGALVIGVCAGAKVVAAAGLLDGRGATTHWYYRSALIGIEPELTYVPDQRFVVDGRVATTTGITASAPMMLTLVEAMAGPERAAAVAADFVGLDRWDARHDSGAFRVTRPFALAALGNRLSFWRHETLAVPVADGVDEVTLALVTDAWSRTWRSRAAAAAAGQSRPGAASSFSPRDRAPPPAQLCRLSETTGAGAARRDAGRDRGALRTRDRRLRRRSARIRMASRREPSKPGGAAEPHA
jgi:putative intracellular protease/amidase